MLQTTTASDLANDHKHWLNEIDRWQGYLRTWIDQETMVRDALAGLQSEIEQYAAGLQAHKRALAAHEQELVACERRLASGGEAVAPELAEAHERSARHHDEQRSVHERLKQQHHTLMALAALLRHEPLREQY